MYILINRIKVSCLFHSRINLASLYINTSTSHITIKMLFLSTKNNMLILLLWFVCVCVCVRTCTHVHSVTQLCSTLCDPMEGVTSLLCPWNFPSKNTGAGCCFLLQNDYYKPECNFGENLYFDYIEFYHFLCKCLTPLLVPLLFKCQKHMKASQENKITVWYPSWTDKKQTKKPKQIKSFHI